MKAKSDELATYKELMRTLAADLEVCKKENSELQSTIDNMKENVKAMFK